MLYQFKQHSMHSTLHITGQLEQRFKENLVLYSNWMFVYYIFLLNAILGLKCHSITMQCTVKSINCKVLLWFISYFKIFFNCYWNMLRLCAKTCFYLNFTCHFIQFASEVLHSFKLSSECFINSFTFSTLHKLPVTWLIQTHLFLWKRHNDVLSKKISRSLCCRIKLQSVSFARLVEMAEFFAWFLRLSFLTQSTWLEQTTHLFLTSARFFNNTSVHGWNRLCICSRSRFTFLDMTQITSGCLRLITDRTWTIPGFPSLKQMYWWLCLVEWGEKDVVCISRERA